LRKPTATQLPKYQSLISTIKESPSWSAGVGHRRDTPMWVLGAMSAVFSVITGGSKRVEIQPHADPLYRRIIVTAELKFWGCVESGVPPALLVSILRRHASKRSSATSSFSRRVADTTMTLMPTTPKPSGG
jgi:hypothetical protein